MHSEEWEFFPRTDPVAAGPQQGYESTEWKSEWEQRDVVTVLVMDYLIRRTFSSVGLVRSVVKSTTNVSGPSGQ